MSNHGVSPNPPRGEPRPPQGGTGAKEKRRPPESERYDELKGKRVVVVTGALAEDVLKGTLRWVDRYTIGLHLDVSILGANDQVWIINKAKVVMIGEA